jgi:hypothetical protein
MKLKEHIYERYSDKLIKLLKKYNIKYSIAGDDKIVPRLIVFDIFLDQPFYSEIKKSTPTTRSHPLVFAEYSTSEIDNADWLMMRPILNRVEVINVEKAFLFSCVYYTQSGSQRVHHKEQKELLQVASEVKWGKKNFFYSIDTGFSEIFINLAVKDMIKKNDIRGAVVKPVLNGSGHYCVNTFQLLGERILNFDAIALGFGERIEKCPICGKTQFSNNNTYQLHIKNGLMDQHMDIYMTASVFGYGIPEPLFIISQRFYRLILEQKMSAEIKFEPIVEVNQG